MNNIPWTLKYRPHSFTEVTGQRAARLVLRRMVDKGDVRSALLFNGSHGSGKTSMARILAAALNCEALEPAERPCGGCPVCISTAEGRSADVTEIDAASSGLASDMRALREAVRFAAQSRYRVVILDEALALDTPIPTPDGWSTVGKISPGEFVIGASGHPTRVVRKTDVRDDAICYRVSFNDGTSMIASENHRWFVKIAARSQWTPRVLTTAEMVLHGGRFQVPVARTPTGRKDGWRAITSIVCVPSVPVQCLEVDAEDHLFVVGDGCVVTHNCHAMSPTGFQTLLKTLEEPPANTVFILVTTHLDKVPDTIASRCLSVEFRRLSEAQVAGRLAQIAEAEGLELSAELARSIAARCKGIARDSVSLLEQCALVGVRTPDQLAVLLGDSDHGLAILRPLAYRSSGGNSPSPLSGDFAGAFEATERALSVLPSPTEVVAALVRTLRRVLCVTSAGESVTLNPPATSGELALAGQLDTARCVTAMRVVWEYYAKVAPAADAYASMDLLVTLLGQALSVSTVKRAA